MMTPASLHVAPAGRPRAASLPDPAALRALQDYAQTVGSSAPADRIDRPMAMTVDGRYRMLLRALPAGGVAVESRLRALPEPGPARDRLLLGVARLACGMLQASPAACVVDARERGVWLRVTTPAVSTTDIDEAVGALANQLAFWQPAVAAV